MTIKTRVEKLEAGSRGPGKHYVITRDYWRRDAEEVDAEEAATRAAMGPDDHVTVLEWVKNWRASDEKPTAAA